MILKSRSSLCTLQALTKQHMSRTQQCCRTFSDASTLTQRKLMMIDQCIAFAILTQNLYLETKQLDLEALEDTCNRSLLLPHWPRGKAPRPKSISKTLETPFDHCVHLESLAQRPSNLTQRPREALEDTFRSIIVRTLTQRQKSSTGNDKGIHFH